ncbi:MAG: PEP-CTERM sorting domain-containing protein [Planctomycetota bacterium]
MPAPALCTTTLAVFVTFLTAGSASASAVFDLTGNVSTPAGAPPIVIAVDTLELMVTGWRADGNSPTGLSPRGLSQTVNGLGVFNGPNSPDSTQIDGRGPDEVLRLTFNRTVLLSKVVFALVGSNDEFDLGIGSDADASSVVDVRVNQTYGSDLITDVATPLGAATVAALDYEFNLGSSVQVGPTSTVSTAPRGKTFEFKVTDGNDDYKIVSVEVEGEGSDGEIDPDATVPEPATLALLVGLSFAALAPRRRAG